MSNEEQSYAFSELEIDALGELMNISFGSAAAGLAEVLDIFINLNIPYTKLIKKNEIAEYIKDAMPGYFDCSMIEQKFHGDFGGSAILLFPYGIEKELLSYFYQPDGIGYESDGLSNSRKR